MAHTLSDYLPHVSAPVLLKQSLYIQSETQNEGTGSHYLDTFKTRLRDVDGSTPPLSLVFIKSLAGSNGQAAGLHRLRCLVVC